MGDCSTLHIIQYARFLGHSSSQLDGAVVRLHQDQHLRGRCHVERGLNEAGPVPTIDAPELFECCLIGWGHSGRTWGALRTEVLMFAVCG